MATKLEPCEHRVVTPRGQMNVCRAHMYGGQVTDGMCRLCLARGDKPAVVARLPRVAVGDLVETMLTSIGITQERVQSWTRTKDCGCKKRQQWLNRWGHEQQARIERLLNRAARWYGIN
jgi:hypothetical protein